MPHQSGEHPDRRESVSLPCSPNATRGSRESRFHGEERSAAAPSNHSEAGHQAGPVTGVNGSQEHEASHWNNTSFDPATNWQASTPPQEPISPGQQSGMSSQEFLYEVYSIILQSEDPNAADRSYYFECATRTPPITPSILAELDVPRIVNNARLRHDINFDRNLQFRQNFDGVRGIIKTRTAEQYWQALEGELFMYGHALAEKMQAHAAQTPEVMQYWDCMLKASQLRLPKLFEAIRDIMQTLVPEQDQESIAARLDVDLLMQEISNGLCDLVDLANWLAKVLKKHCAPMRDSLVDSMRLEVQRGALNDNVEQLVSGLRQVLSILELMKIDVANHQVKHMRSVLVNDTVKFQRRYNEHRIGLGKIDANKVRQWLARELLALRCNSDSEPTHLEALTAGLLRGLLYDDSEPFPQHFYLDEARLLALREDIFRTVRHQLCRDVLAEMAPPSLPAHVLQKAQDALQGHLSDITGPGGVFFDHFSNIAAEIVRVLLMVEGRHQFPFDTSLFHLAEQKVALALEPASAAFDKAAKDICDSMLKRLKGSIEQHVNMSEMARQDAQVPKSPEHIPPPPLGFGAICAPPPDASAKKDPEDDFVDRLTHIICLHWRVWADIYLAIPERGVDNGTHVRRSSPPPVPANSPASGGKVAFAPPNGLFIIPNFSTSDFAGGMPTPAPSSQPTQEANETSSEREDASNEHETLDNHQQRSA